MQLRSARRKTDSPRAGSPLAATSATRAASSAGVSGLTSVEIPAARPSAATSAGSAWLERHDGAQGRLGGVGGDGVPLDRRGQGRAAALAVEERRHQRLEVHALRGRRRDEFRGAGRGGVQVQPGQRGDRRASGSPPAGPDRRGPRSPLGPPCRRSPPAPRSPTRAVPSVGLRRPGDLTQQLGRRLQLPRPREPDRRTSQRPVLRGSPPSRPTSFSRSFSGFRPRVDAASARASSALTRSGGGEPSQGLLIDVVQVGDGPALADHLDDRALALLGHAPALEQLDHRAVGRRDPRPAPRDVRDPGGEQARGSGTAPGSPIRASRASSIGIICRAWSLSR